MKVLWRMLGKFHVRLLANGLSAFVLSKSEEKSLNVKGEGAFRGSY